MKTLELNNYSKPNHSYTESVGFYCYWYTPAEFNCSANKWGSPKEAIFNTLADVEAKRKEIVPNGSNKWNDFILASGYEPTRIVIEHSSDYKGDYTKKRYVYGEDLVKLEAETQARIDAVSAIEATPILEAKYWIVGGNIYNSNEEAMDDEFYHPSDLEEASSIEEANKIKKSQLNNENYGD